MAFSAKDREKRMGTKHMGTVTTMTFDFIGPLPRVVQYVPYVDTRAQSLSSIRATGIRFHEGRIPCNQTLGPNGFRTMHVGCGCYIDGSQQIEEKQRKRRSSTLYIEIS